VIKGFDSLIDIAEDKEISRDTKIYLGNRLKTDILLFEKLCEIDLPKEVLNSIEDFIEKGDVLSIYLAESLFNEKLREVVKRSKKLSII
jgi:hypothetical protein